MSVTARNAEAGLKQALDVLKVELRAARLLHSATGPEEMARDLCGILRDLPAIDAGGFYLLDDREKDYRLAAHWGLSGEFVDEVSRVGLESGRPVFVNYRVPGTAADPRVGLQNGREGLRAIAVFPIVFQGRTLGSMNLASRSMDAFPESVATAIRSIGRQAANAFARIRAEQTLARQREDVLSTLENHPEMILAADADGVVLFANRVARETLGYPPGMIPLLRVEDMHPADCRAEARACFSAIVRNEACRCSLPLLARDGRRIPVDILSSKGSWNGRPAWFAVMHDMTAHFEREARIREQDARFESLAEATRDGLLVVSSGGFPVYANSRAAELAGRPMEEIHGIPAWEWIRETDGNPMESWLAESVAPGARPGLREGIVRSPRGETPVEIARVFVRWDAKPAALLEIRDITVRLDVQRQVLRAVNWEKGSLARTLHDGISQRLTAARFLCHAVEKNLAASAGPDALRVAEAGSILEETVNRIRSAARGLNPDLKGVSLAENLARFAESASSIYGLPCRFRHVGNLDAESGRRAEHLYYIAQEAVLNAVRHGRATAIEIEAGRNGEGTIRLEIRNDGTGFDPGAVATHSFGLRIMRYRAEQIGGRLAIESIPSGGTRVVCEAPAPASSGAGWQGRKSESTGGAA